MLQRLVFISLFFCSFAFSFEPFTGKVTANKVRVRIKPDLESTVLKQFQKEDLLLVVDQVGDFYAIEPPTGTKAFIFRSYILDGIVEANRVNVRLAPHVDAPILGQLHSGDRAEGHVSSLNRKWLEIAVPSTVRFYISKEFVDKVGDGKYLAIMEKRQKEVKDLLASAYALAEEECKKSYEEMHPQIAIEKFQLALKNYRDFPKEITQAKEGLALLKETYLNKKIAFLEAKEELNPTAKEELLAKHKKENEHLFSDVTIDPLLWEKRNAKQEITASMQAWDAIEESLYLSWSSFHQNKKISDFYKEQEANATFISGVLEEYTDIVEEKPGDYVLKKKGAPIAYLYSTKVNLEKRLGQEVQLKVAARPNHHFAFPAYFVLQAE